MRKKLALFSIFLSTSLLFGCAQNTDNEPQSKDKDSEQKAAATTSQLDSVANDYREYALGEIAEFTQATEAFTTAVQSRQIDKANEILTIWPMVEGDVSTRDSKLYSDMETKIPTAISLLDSKKVQAEEAQSIITDLNKRLLPLTHETSYSIWDASLILLREGLEALLIVATLLSFLKRVNQSDKQKWIWIGVAAGLAASVVLSVIISFVFSQITAASSREYLEGMIGIVAVVMMLTVGAWLHSKSNIHSWNRYIDNQMNQAIATGKLVSFALISFFSIFREGAETIIFYSGMAPYMSMKTIDDRDRCSISHFTCYWIYYHSLQREAADYCFL